MSESCGETRRGGRLPESLPLSVKRSIFVLRIYRLVRRIIVINIFDICQIPPVGIIRLKHPPVQILRKTWRSVLSKPREKSLPNDGEVITLATIMPFGFRRSFTIRKKSAVTKFIGMLRTAEKHRQQSNHTFAWHLA